MRKFIFAAVGAFAFSASGSEATLTSEEVAECVRECTNAQDGPGGEAAQTRACDRYTDKRPHPLLVNICEGSYKLGGANGCERGCKSQACSGLRFDSEVVAARDLGCKQFQSQMPRPAAYEICKEAYMKGFEGKCAFVEAELARAAAEEEDAELAGHLRELDMAVEQQQDSLAFQQKALEEEQAAQAAAKAAAEAAEEAAKKAAAEAEAARFAAEVEAARIAAAEAEAAAKAKAEAEAEAARLAAEAATALRGAVVDEPAAAPADAPAPAADAAPAGEAAAPAPEQA